MIRVLFLLLGLGTIGLVMAAGGGLVFIDAASTIVVIVPSVLCRWISGPGALGAAISAADGEEPVEAGLGAKHRQVLQSLRTALCLWRPGFLIGLVHMLQNLSDPTAVGRPCGGAPDGSLRRDRLGTHRRTAHRPDSSSGAQ